MLSASTVTYTSVILFRSWRFMSFYEGYEWDEEERWRRRLALVRPSAYYTYTDDPFHTIYLVSETKSHAVTTDHPMHSEGHAHAGSSHLKTLFRLDFSRGWNELNPLLTSLSFRRAASRFTMRCHVSNLKKCSSKIISVPWRSPCGDKLILLKKPV
ncbi:hypothetical protein Tco_0099545 [Tanacetum coccineum]